MSHAQQGSHMPFVQLPCVGKQVDLKRPGFRAGKGMPRDLDRAIITHARVSIEAFAT